MRQALELALEALEEAWYHVGTFQPTEKAIDLYDEARAAIKEALAQPEQEPLEYWNAVEGWVKIDEVREHFDSVGCATIYKTAGEGRVPLSLALAQPEQEPVAYINIEERKLEWAYKYMSWDTPTVINLPKIPLYTTPPQRKPLTDEELRVIENKINPNMRWRSSDEEGITLYPSEYYDLVKAIEAAYGIFKENV